MKEKITGLIVGIAVGVTAGIGLGWLFLTERGAQYRKQISEKFKEEISNTAAEVIDKKTIISKKAAKVATDAVIKISNERKKTINCYSRELPVDGYFIEIIEFSHNNSLSEISKRRC